VALRSALEIYGYGHEKHGNGWGAWNL